MDAGGTVVARQTCWPYGAVPSATGVTQTDKLFTGQRQEPPAGDALGLYDYRARFYSTTLGRFVSADPTNGSGLNRYAYVLDNPLRFVDPSGTCFTFPGHPTFSCSPQDLLNWIHCALTCGNNWLGDIARYGLGLGEFWKNAFRLTYDPVVEMRVLNVIAVAAVGGHDTDVIPASGWGALGGHEGVSGPFFKASFLDLILGATVCRTSLLTI